MQAKKTSKFIDYFAQDYRRGIVIGVILLVAIILIVIFRSRIKGLFQRISNKVANNEMENQWSSQTGEVATIARAQFNVMANKLYAAAKGAGTDEDAIYSVFNQLSNTADLYALISAYGTKDGLDLPAMIRDELGNHWPTYELDKLNKILTNKGISYQF